MAQGTPVGNPLINIPLSFSVVEFSPDGYGLVASTHDGTIFGWEIPSRRPLFKPISGAHTSHLLKLSFSPDGKYFASAGTDGKSVLFEYPSGRVIGRAFRPEEQISTVIFAFDERVLIGGNADGALCLWDLDKQKQTMTTPRGHSKAVMDADLSTESGMLTTLGQDQVIRFWSMRGKYPQATTRKVVGQSAKGVAFSGDGKFLAAGDDTGAVQIWDLESDKLLMVLQGHSHQVWALTFYPDNHMLASGDRAGQIRIWKLDNGALHRTIDAHAGPIWSLMYRSDEKQIISTGNGEVHVWNAQTGKRLTTLKQGAGTYTRGAQSPAGSQLALTTTVGMTQIWNLDSGELEKEIKADDDLLWSAAFSPDSRSLAVASSDEVVTVWDLETGKQQAAFTGHSGGATDVAYLSDGVTLVAVDRYGRLHWWDIKTGRRLSDEWPAHTRASWRLAVHPDGMQIATTGDDGRVSVWDELSIDRACKIGLRAFDEIRQRQYLGQNERSVACN